VSQQHGESEKEQDGAQRADEQPPILPTPLVITGRRLLERPIDITPTEPGDGSTETEVA